MSVLQGNGQQKDAHGPERQQADKHAVTRKDAALLRVASLWNQQRSSYVTYVHRCGRVGMLETIETVEPSYSGSRKSTSGK